MQSSPRLSQPTREDALGTIAISWVRVKNELLPWALPVMRLLTSRDVGYQRVAVRSALGERISGPTASRTDSAGPVSAFLVGLS
jgi:hypothetical protein